MLCVGIWKMRESYNFVVFLPLCQRGQMECNAKNWNVNATTKTRIYIYVCVVDVSTPFEVLIWDLAFWEPCRRWYETSSNWQTTNETERNRFVLFCFSNKNTNIKSKWWIIIKKRKWNEEIFPKKSGWEI